MNKTTSEKIFQDDKTILKRTHSDYCPRVREKHSITKLKLNPTPAA